MASTTPKLDNIIREFAQRIQDPVTFNGSFNVVPGKVITTAASLEAYITESMFILINQVWLQCAQAPKPLEKFAEIFPELVVSRNVTLVASKYTIGSDAHNYDFMYLLSAVVDNKLAAVKPSYLYTTAVLGHPQIRGDAEHPIVIEKERSINVFPAATFSSSTVTLLFIKQPLVETSGLYLTQNGGAGSESPFYDQWNSKIAEIAMQQFLIKQGGSR